MCKCHPAGRRPVERCVCKLQANTLPTPQTDWAQRIFQSNQIGLICRAHLKTTVCTTVLYNNKYTTYNNRLERENQVTLGNHSMTISKSEKP